MDSHLPIGTILRSSKYSYRIEKVLGQGSFGITYLADVVLAGELGSLSSNLRVCLKEFYMGEVNGRDGNSVVTNTGGTIVTDYRRKFRTEAKNLASLHHPNIIKVLELFDANNTSYYAMEYVDGINLDDYIKKCGRLNETETVRIIRQVGDAVACMHRNKMLHLDIKPKNIMIRRNGDAVLIDFGLSKQYDANGDPESSTSLGGGTAGYAPIEQSSFHKGPGFQATMDIYALGATMFKMLSGHRPDDASTILNNGFPTDQLRKIGVSERMINVVRKAMEPIRKNRFQSVDEMIRSIPMPGDIGGRDNDEVTHFAEVEDADTTIDSPKSSNDSTSYGQPQNPPRQQQPVRSTRFKQQQSVPRDNTSRKKPAPNANVKRKRNSQLGATLGTLFAIIGIVVYSVRRCDNINEQYKANTQRIESLYSDDDTEEDNDASFDSVAADVNQVADNSDLSDKSSPDETEAVYTEAANIVNKSAPMEVDEYTTLDNCDFSDGCFNYHYTTTLSTSAIDWDVMESNIRKAISTDKDLSSLASELAGDGYGMSFEYTDADEVLHHFAYSASDLKRIIK